MRRRKDREGLGWRICGIDCIKQGKRDGKISMNDRFFTGIDNVRSRHVVVVSVLYLGARKHQPRARQSQY